MLDAYLPVFRHRERHARAVRAAPGVVWDALHAVTARELALSRVLVAIRALWASPGADGLERRLDEPFVTAVPTRRGFVTLRDEPPRTLVAGAVMRPWTRDGGHVDGLTGPAFEAFAEPGWVRTAISFELEPFDDGRTRLTTETRIHPTSPDAARRFAAYWLVIRAGSDLIRRDTLRAVAARAEQPDADRVVA